MARRLLALSLKIIAFVAFQGYFAGMLLFYFDESGDSGHPAVVTTPTRFFLLSAVVLNATAWLPVLDKLIGLRRRIRDNFGISTRPEIKAQDFRAGRGVLRGLAITETERLDFYRSLMRFQETDLPEIRCFSIAIDKSKVLKQTLDIRETAWVYALQRVDSICKEDSELAILFPDEGHGPLVKS